MLAAPLILSIETATLAGAVALSQGSNVVASRTSDNQASHSNTLLREIETVLKVAGRTLAEIDLFAVASGPGSFTGLRIGIATVKALAVTLERPCVGIPTLEAIAHSAGVCERVVAALPAGRGEVFVQMFSVSAESVTPLDSATHISPSKMLEKYASFDEICWCGEGAHLNRDIIKDGAEDKHRSFVEENGMGWRLLPRTANLAENVASLALRRIQKNEIQNAEDITAIYVRPSDAELKTRS